MARLNYICAGHDRKRFFHGVRSLRILFLYNSDWSKEIRDYECGLVPSHRLFGYAEMQKSGHVASTCPAPFYFRHYFKRPIAWRFHQALYAVIHQRRFDGLIAAHEAAALPLLLFKRIGLLRTPLLVISVALLHPRNGRGMRKLLWRLLLPAAEIIVCYASVQVDWLATAYSLDRRRLAFVPLGVDTDFFSPSRCETIDAQAESGSTNAGQCISVGTNEGKDFPTLLAALPAGVRLTIVTDEYNARLVERAASRAFRESRMQVLENVPIDRLRELYCRAALHIIPLRESRFSSGQTVLLENMALGKTVIVSDTSAVRDYVQNQMTAISVRPGDVAQMNEEIAAALADPSRCRTVGIRAAAEVKEKFSAMATGEKLAALLQAVCRS